MAELNVANRTLFHGDNLPFLRGINSGTIQLIATDPPFNKNKDFHMPLLKVGCASSQLPRLEPRLGRDTRVGLCAPLFGLSPNPPKDTDGRREDSGRGWVRELQGRWPGVLG